MLFLVLLKIPHLPNKALLTRAAYSDLEDMLLGNEECLKWQMSLFPGGVFSVYEKYCFATVNPLCL